MVAKSALARHESEAMVEAMVGIYVGESSFQGFLRWCEMDCATIRSMTRKSFRSEILGIFAHEDSGHVNLQLGLRIG